MTTTRTVFAFSNRIMNDNYLKFALEPDASGKYRSLGDAVKEAKITPIKHRPILPTTASLLGDPALTLAFPTIKARPIFYSK